MKENLIFIKLIFFLVGVIFVGGRAEAQVNAEQCVTIGRNVLSMDDYMLSIQYFNQAIKAKPYLSEPYFFRGLAKLYLEDYKGAEEDCTLAIERNKYKTESYKVRGFARQYLGKDSLAIEDYNIGLADNPQDKYFLFYKAVAETELKRFEDADSTFSRLTRLYPKFEDGISARARLRMLQGDTISALKDLDEAILMAPALLNPYLMRAEIYSRQQKWAEACADMDQAVKLNPQEADYYLNRAFLRYNNDDFIGAMADYNTALDLRPYNVAALFNRALLRYEVRDLQRAVKDLEEVLRIEPDNFHAKYNESLILLELGKYREAIEGFEAIAKRYPRFYPAYYAIAEARHKMGDMRSALQNVNKAEDLIKRYVKNPGKFKLDKPTIASGSNSKGFSDEVPTDGDDEGTEEDMKVMERFNQLVTVKSDDQPRLSYNERIKGRVQDRDMTVELQPSYMLSFNPSGQSLKTTSNYFRELDNFNQDRYISEAVYLIPEVSVSETPEDLDALFSKTGYYNGLIKDGAARPADYFALGVAETMLKNYQEAIKAFDKAIEGDPRFSVAIMARGYARRMQAYHPLETASGNSAVNAEMRRRMESHELAEAIRDFDSALALNPRLVYAWFNKGNIYYELGDYPSAMQCYTEALRIDPEFGEAYFNRGLSYFRLGNKRSAFVDLSKAGESGVIQSYNILKRMK